MIVSGVKHACATCIRGHRSSSCTHADRQLYEIRKKGRPISQCPHCRDLRKLKSCHTRCECGESTAEQGKSSACKCHTGQPCICAGPSQNYQYVPPELSSRSDSVVSDGARTPSDTIAPLLHTFSSTPTTAAPGATSTQIKTQHSSPYAGAYALRENEADSFYDPSNIIVPGHAYSTYPTTQWNAASITGHAPRANHTTYSTPQYHERHSVDRAVETFFPQHTSDISCDQASSNPPSISRTTRSIGTNTDPIPSGIWPDDLFALPVFAAPAPHVFQPQVNHVSHGAQTINSSPFVHCPKVKDMPLQDLGFDPLPANEPNEPIQALPGLYDSSAFATSGAQLGDVNDLQPADHYEEEFDPEYFNSLFDVPGCALPGVQCRCGDGCSCEGCQTHRDNHDKVAMEDFARMDFSSTRRTREHPAGCCDTRSIHAQAVPHPGGGCCGGS